ncbi:hypothetical protein QFC21_006600 [Naganishia friedmannii]|uniref:Uncharacterized protein n=1 Tax=Naganishia friedmannii TaxID=89922 RepID=A0ACC2V0M9_9TREE|nr:hypothetical protein QFC21_006600 [Naganishia friedmannii]
MTSFPTSGRLTASTSAGFSTLPSPSTPYTALHNPSAKPYTSAPAAVPQRKYPDPYVGGQSRATKGKIFPEEYLRDRYRYRVQQPDNLRPAQYADLSVAEYLRSVAQDANKIKEHRVLNTYPRDPPSWSQALINETKLAVGDQTEQDISSRQDDTPMWDLQYIDSPWNDYQAHFKSVAAHDQEWRRQVKSHRVEVEAQWKEEEEREKQLASGAGVRAGASATAPPSASTTNGLPGASIMPGTPAPALTAPSTPSAGGDQHFDESQLAPGSLPFKKQKSGINGTPAIKPPTLSKAAQQANAKKLEEQRSAQQMTQELTRSMGRKRKAWMLGGAPGGGASSPGTPTADLLGKKKRKLGEGKPELGDGSGADLTGSPMPNKTMSSIIPGSPIPLGKRAGTSFTAAIPSGLNPHAKRMKSVAPEEASSPATAGGMKSESSTPAPEQDHQSSSTPKDIYDFPEVQDTMTIQDIRTAYRRRIHQGGAFKRVLEQRHEVMLLEMARREHSRYVAQQGGALGKKEAKPVGGGLLSLSRYK